MDYACVYIYICIIPPAAPETCSRFQSLLGIAPLIFYVVASPPSKITVYTYIYIYIGVGQK